MDVTFACPHCQSVLRMDAQFAGGQVSCPTCGQGFMVGALPQVQPVPVAQPQVVAQQPPRGPVTPPGPRRPGPPQPHRPPGYVPSPSAAQSDEGETKARLIFGGVAVVGVAVLVGVFQFISGKMADSRGRHSGLKDLIAFNDAQAKANLEQLKRDEAARKAEEDKERARLRDYLSLSVCEGNDEVAGELLTALEGVNTDLEGALASGRLPQDVPGFMQQRLLARITANATLRHWFGSRNAAGFARAVFTPRNRAGGAPTEGVPDFLASGKYVSTGTGFFISQDGWLLTNQHVVGDATEVDIRTGTGAFQNCRVVKTDAKADVALLKLDGQNPGGWLAIHEGDAAMGTGVFTIGFPHPAVQGIEPKFTDGRISALSGILDDAGHYQISVPLQSGNSGGPLVHLQNGGAVGMVCSKLSATATSDRPENVNYAIKASVIRNFLKTTGAADALSQTAPAGGSGDESAAIARVKSATVLVLVKRA